MSDWSLITTIPNSSLGVSERLKALGVEHLVVRQRVRLLSRGRRVERFINAFFNYVFVKASGLWSKILDTKGVIGFVYTGQEPARVSEEVIMQLRSRCSGDVLDLPIAPRFAFGQRVQIQGRGPFCGVEGIFQFVLPNGRAYVHVELAGRWVPVEINENDLVSVSRRMRSARQTRRGRRRRAKLESTCSV